MCVCGVHTELIVECDALKHALVGERLFRWALGDQSGALGPVLVLHRHQEERERVETHTSSPSPVDPPHPFNLTRLSIQK